MKLTKQEELVVRKEFEKAEQELSKGGATNLLVSFEQFQNNMIQIKLNNPLQFKEIMVEHLKLN